MIRLIYRQRRRLVFATFLVVLSIFMLLVSMLGTNDFAYVQDQALWITLATIVITVLVCGLIGFVAFSLWLVLFPNWRFMIEQMALMFFIFQAFEALWPAYDAVPYIGVLLPVIVFFAIFMTAYGTTLDRFPVSLGMDTTRTFVSKKSPEQLWQQLVPLAQHSDTHWDSLLTTIEADTDAGQQKATYNHGASIFQFQRQSFTELDAPHRATYRFDGDVSDATKPITGGTYEVLIEPTVGGKTHVTLRETHDALLPRVAIQSWFDDDLGDKVDTFRARDLGKRDWSVSGRYRRKVASLS